MFVGVLEGLHQPQSLVHRSSHGKIVHGDLPQDASVVDDEESPERGSSTIYCQLSTVSFNMVVTHIPPHCRSTKCDSYSKELQEDTLMPPAPVTYRPLFSVTEEDKFHEVDRV